MRRAMAWGWVLAALTVAAGCKLDVKVGDGGGGHGRTTAGGSGNTGGSGLVSATESCPAMMGGPCIAGDVWVYDGTCGGCTPACTPGNGQTCNDDPSVSALRGTCNADRTCTCTMAGTAVSPTTGKCVLNCSVVDCVVACPSGTKLVNDGSCCGKCVSTAVCTPGLDDTCNADPSVNAIWGKCNADGTCTCTDASAVLNTKTGKCEKRCLSTVCTPCGAGEQPIADGTCCGSCIPDAACTYGANQTCNDDLLVSSIWGKCSSSGDCSCNAGRGLNTTTGKCMLCSTVTCTSCRAGTHVVANGTCCGACLVDEMGTVVDQEIVRLGLSTKDVATLDAINLPQVTETGWSVLADVCKQGGFDLVPYAGMNVQRVAVDVSDSCGPTGATLWVLTQGSKVVCSYETTLRTLNSPPTYCATKGGS